ncbi:MAG: class I tRNA ligase family protein, partial [Bacteroidales bacterium]|nr:class I tRNA ligase family protein [Bacteroidales bacterium]
RFWNKFLFDIGMVCESEPFRKLINQGKIQGRSSFVYRIKGTNKFVSYNLRNSYDTARQHVDINLVDNDVLDQQAFRNWLPDLADAEFVLEEGKYVCGWEIEKMSKSKHNVQNPDELIKQYGADTLRLYEMFLGPLEYHKPWNTNGIEGVFRFMKKLWKLYHDDQNRFYVSDDDPDEKELKVIHNAIKRVEEDINRFSFNTVVSTLMICVNELTELKCHKRSVLETLAVLVSSYAPHIAEEFWQLLGHDESITYATFPVYNEQYLKVDSIKYPVSFNGKVRFTLELPVDMTIWDIEKIVLADEQTQKRLQGKEPRKVIIVPKRIINIVV